MPFTTPGSGQRPHDRGRRDARLRDGLGARGGRTPASTAWSCRSAAARSRARSSARSRTPRCSRRPSGCRRSTRCRPRAATRSSAPTAGPRARRRRRDRRAHRRGDGVRAHATGPSSCGRGSRSRRASPTGILDDETYDWAAVVAGMLATDGSPRGRFRGRAPGGERARARDHRHRRRPHGLVGPRRPARARAPGRDRTDERVAVLFTGMPTGRRNRHEELRRTGHPVAEGLRARGVHARVRGLRPAPAPCPRPPQHRPAEGQDAAHGLLPAEHAHPHGDRGRDAPPRRARARVLGREDDARRRLLPGVDQGHRPHARVLRGRHRDAALRAGRAGRGREARLDPGHQLRRRLGRAPDAGPHRPLHDVEGEGPPRRPEVPARRRHAHAHDALDPVRVLAASTSSPTSSARPRCRSCPSSRPSSTSGTSATRRSGRSPSASPTAT